MEFPFTIRNLPSDTDKTEKLLRYLYPGIQVRFCGLQYGPFPHHQRPFYASVAVDGTGMVLSATIVNSIMKYIFYSLNE